MRSSRDCASTIPSGARSCGSSSYTQPKGIRRYLHTHLGTPSHNDTSRVTRDFGYEYRPLEATLADTIRDQVARGHIIP